MKKKNDSKGILCRYQWPRGLRRGPWSLGHSNRGFESRLWQDCLSSYLCVVLRCVGRGLWDGLIRSQKETYRVYKQITVTSPCVRRPRSMHGLESQRGKKEGTSKLWSCLPWKNKSWSYISAIIIQRLFILRLWIGFCVGVRLPSQHCGFGPVVLSPGW
jgi:hypothetical protein